MLIFSKRGKAKGKTQSKITFVLLVYKVKKITIKKENHSLMQWLRLGIL